MDIDLDFYDDGRDEDYMRWLECHSFRDSDDEDRPARNVRSAGDFVGSPKNVKRRRRKREQ